MDNQVRLLPAVIGAAAVLVVLRLASMSIGQEAAFSGSGTASAAEVAAPAEAAPAVAATTPPADATSTSAPAKANGASSTAGTAGAGQAQNKGEADVLHGLSDRRGELDVRENELALREQLLAAAQKQVDEKIAQLKEIQSKLDTMLAQRDDVQKAQLNALVKMYENMKPADAAKIFDKLDRRILTDVAGGMKPAKVGAVLAAMDPAKAQELTALLASKLLLAEPQRLDVSAATPGAAPAPSADLLPVLPAATTEPTAPATAPAG